MEWYERRDVQEAIAREAEGKEIGVKYEWGFGKRPDVIASAADVHELAKNGATSFHFSEETWSNPLALSPELSRKELDTLRTGWDLIIDIDTPHFPYSKIPTELILKVLAWQGIKHLSVKFSGNHGFHIVIPFEAFPANVLNQDVKMLFPEAPRKIAAYLKSKIEEKVLAKILETDAKEEIEKNIGEPLPKNFGMDDIVDIDTLLISSRHLCRMPYSLNEKAGLVSLPITPEEVPSFSLEQAKPENIKTLPGYIKRAVPSEEAKNLFVAAFDANIEDIKQEHYKDSIPKRERTFEELQQAAPEALFPDCITKLLRPLQDGKKRALFVLIHFLANVGWTWESIEKKIEAWNKQHPEPLREVYWRGQIRYAKRQEKKLPPNCSNEAYYKALQVKCDSSVCTKCKNPVNHTKRRVFMGTKEK